jgi:hypothetical protein
MVRDQATEIVERARALRSPTKPIAAKPMRNIAQADGSGTPERRSCCSWSPHRQRPRPNCFPNRSWSLGLARRRQNRALIRPGPIDSDGSKGAARWANSLRASRVADRAQERGRGR